MKTTIHNPRAMGAIPMDGATHFRVWAPHATSVAVVGEFNNWNPGAHLLAPENDGLWARAVAGARPGQQYQFEIINGDRTMRKNDAYVREIHPEKATSVIYDGDKFKWNSPQPALAHWNEMVIYELHVGNFEPGPAGSPGRFDQIIGRLPYLKGLGINAIELMPPMAFPNERSWGYSLTNPFAVESSYGGPDGLKRLIDAAHGQGIGIILDVVYNHFGPDQLDLWQYDGWSENDLGGIYFYNDHRAWTPWGNNRPDYGRGEVRQYIRDNAMLWLEEFHVDGLRFDSTIFVRNAVGENNRPDADIPEGWSLIQWVNDEIERHFPGRISIAEDITQNHWITKPTRESGLGHHSQWDGAFIYPVRNAVVSSNDDDRSMDAVAGAIRFRYNEDAIQRVIFSESHDSVANGSARLPQEIDPNDTAGYFARKRSTLAAGLVLTTPGIPMIFEGQEFLENGWFRDDVTLDWKKLDTFKGINRLYRDLIHLRLNLFGNTKGLTGPFVRVIHANNLDKVIAFHRWAEGGPKDDVIVLASFTHREIEENYRIGFPRGGAWTIRFNSDWKGYSPDFHEVGNPDGQVIAENQEYDGCEFSGLVALPSYGLVILSQETADEPPSPSQSMKIRIQHRTTYNYNEPVSFGQHKIMIRPREGHDLHIESSVLEISPAHTIHWMRDVNGNSIAKIDFTKQANQLMFYSELVLQHYDANPLDFILEESAVNYPFVYDPESLPELTAFTHIIYPKDMAALREWILQFWKPGDVVETIELLQRINRHIHDTFQYQRRDEAGVQTSGETLKKNSGSCRDFATLLLEACRCWGLASRFVSGYMLCPATEAGGASTHAWAEVYLPGAGWKGFDPTSGVMTGAQYVTVAVARDPENAAPISGSFSGPPNAFKDIQVDVTVVQIDKPEPPVPIQSIPAQNQTQQQPVQQTQQSQQVQQMQQSALRESAPSEEMFIQPTPETDSVSSCSLAASPEIFPKGFFL